ncbi:5-oxopent-3-ene-1,2,5-tricarboxylate decarboxylase/2-hydroxyhepta-2,4-diene-1,7-dioate isomerase [Acinetobacter baylyi]|uniref:5-oxopent-3-ene-1,2,5-tricarboxylate decarboxylase/2-hydroxyhepta-2,4-diene-1,7-dioate isomerase n=1 Tax=Acinetobacter baylyi TaxID=202950 RepID=A0ABU0UT47_ACIBI|nr:fumarylacetoacetate hydrolase family protein [Acinetobacter baylyi]MDQ1207723.1 5-oxopent-3-ene-1,2,5-tricarboxylate decarboxylase/2-hydroxyhepta-2,4-diene-1,7-dioate isomerase [Acinetobacter baylyi]MDR6105200.1 5-oxopent-3-ene-1,2,5-tricarboxylate decarboxylase/2-hydroxyhepta-2,4-diene-1,7-dioate isomerase [Acinetobacter baylyi]MDR6184593.1 5-oxopent-3-ene-1,2,5-tricarboxylate decarboxylase/2-hydroxyhepta-2,4-diene-1,7-dioate isomerase [Acinetobacter baylyi]
MENVESIKTDGNIFGVALNYKCLYESLRTSFNKKPYINEPIKPVLFIKTPNTRNVDQGQVIKQKNQILQAGPSLGVVIGKSTSRVSQADAIDHIAGYVVINEFSLPEDTYYRPAIKAKCQDGFCAIGDVVAKQHVQQVNQLQLSVWVNGELKQQGTTANWIRSPEQLIAEMSDYMILNEGDIILTGTPLGRVDLENGDEVTIEIEQIGKLTNHIVEQDASS